MKTTKTTALIIVALTLLPLRMLNMNEKQLLPSNATERANAAVETAAPSATLASSVSDPAPKAVLSVIGSVNVWVTAYASVPQETDNTPFITASNKHVEDGFIAANFLPFGTKVKIPSVFGDKIFTVEDRMSPRKTDFVDIWMPSVADAKDFGIHRAEILVLSDLSGNLAER